MRAVFASKDGFFNRSVASPVIRSNDVKVTVDATSINPHDIKAMAQLSDNHEVVYGYDVVGHISAIGNAVKHFNIGQRVIYSGTDKRQGSLAEEQVVDEKLIAKVDDRFSDIQLAGVPLVGLTAYELLFEQMNFIASKNANTGKKLLVINGAGGVGSILTQLAHWSGLIVFATASPNHFQELLRNKVDTVVDYHKTLGTQLNTFVDGTAILSNLDDYFDDAVQLTLPHGVIGTTVSSKEGLQFSKLFEKSLTLSSEMVFTKANTHFRDETQGQILKFLINLMKLGEINPVISKVISGGITAKNLSYAANILSTEHTVGKIVILNGSSN